LGREGSDYTAAIFANLLNAESVTIWKDVEGVMNADPKAFQNVILISELSFDEVIEMAYYGAQVIHPKTIKPLQNKGIPLKVKCFLDPSLPGTIIHKKNIKNLPPIIVVKDSQALIHLHSQDFSFIGEEPMAWLYKIFAQLNIKPNLIQTGAISLQIGLDNREDKIQQLASAASGIFDVQVEKGLQLLTIRHYTAELFTEMSKGKDIILSQQTKETVQILYK
jgi:aspartate kinase